MKPVLFDLVLLLSIVVYLAVIYVLVDKFYFVVRALTPKKAKKVD